MDDADEFPRSGEGPAVAVATAIEDVAFPLHHLNCGRPNAAGTPDKTARQGVRALRPTRPAGP